MYCNFSSHDRVSTISRSSLCICSSHHLILHLEIHHLHTVPPNPCDFWTGVWINGPLQPFLRRKLDPEFRPYPKCLLHTSFSRNVFDSLSIRLFCSSFSIEDFFYSISNHTELKDTYSLDPVTHTSFSFDSLYRLLWTLLRYIVRSLNPKVRQSSSDAVSKFVSFPLSGKEKSGKPEIVVHTIDLPPDLFWSILEYLYPSINPGLDRTSFCYFYFPPLSSNLSGKTPKEPYTSYSHPPLKCMIS